MNVAHVMNTPASIEQNVIKQSLYRQLVTDVQHLSLPSKQALHSLYDKFAQGITPKIQDYNLVVSSDTQNLLSIRSECDRVTACFGCFCGNYRSQGGSDASNKNKTEHLVQWQTGSAFAWCIWDAFFIAKTVGQPAKISSIDPINHQQIEIYFDGLAFKSMPLWFSFPLGNPNLMESIRSCFCCRTKAFTSPDTAKTFAKDHDCEVVDMTQMLERTEDMVAALRVA